jgi:hypothetical protein
VDDAESLLGGFHFDFEHLAPFVKSTVRANSMRQNPLVTIAAFHQRRRADGVVGASAISATFAQFSFWQRDHLLNSLSGQPYLDTLSFHLHVSYNFISSRFIGAFLIVAQF